MAGPWWWDLESQTFVPAFPSCHSLQKDLNNGDNSEDSELFPCCFTLLNLPVALGHVSAVGAKQAQLARQIGQNGEKIQQIPTVRWFFCNYLLPQLLVSSTVCLMSALRWSWGGPAGSLLNMRCCRWNPTKPSLNTEVAEDSQVSAGALKVTLLGRTWLILCDLFLQRDWNSVIPF